MKNVISFIALLYFVSVNSLNAQTINLTEKAKLPSILNESSGIETSDRNHIWSHNDSGGNHELYEFDSSGILLRTLNIQNSTNHDWEELARDSSGNIYIGDFGNNNNNRSNLAIYKIANPDSFTGTSIASQKISFTYPDQNNFPPINSLLNFDMEAFFWFEHSLYLFSKNRTVPYDGLTKLYRLPENAGTYTATLLDSFYTGTGPYYVTSITSADISPDGKLVALLSGLHVFLFSNFTGDNFFDGTAQELNFSSLTQKEAIVFISNHEIYLTDEQTDTVGNTGNLYYADLSSFIATSISSINKKEDFILFPNPSKDGNFQIQGNEKLMGSKIFIRNNLGELIFESSIKDTSSFFSLHLPVGIYFLQMNSPQAILQHKLLVY